MAFQEELLEILEVQLKLLGNIKEISFEKTDVILESRVDQLEVMTKKEEELINVMGKLEMERRKLLNTWGLNQEMSLKDMIQNIPQGKEELEEVREALLEISLEIKDRNNTNNELINDNLDWLDFNMNLLTDAQGPSTYGDGKARPKSKSANSLFDRKV